MSTDSKARVIDEDLWQRVKAAILPVNAVIDKYLADGGPVPTMDFPELEAANSDQWPSVTPPSRATRKVPVYYKLFEPPSGEFAYEDIPQLVDVMDYVADKPELIKRLSPSVDPSDVDGARWSAALIVVGVADRARALGRPHDHETLLAAYRECERSLLAPVLDADVVAPLLLTTLELDEYLELGDGVRLEKLTDEIQLARASLVTGLDAAPSRLVMAATHAVVLTGVEVRNSPLEGSRDIALREPLLFRSHQPELPFEKLDLAVECLRVVTDVPTGYAQVFLRPVGWADYWTYTLTPVFEIDIVPQYPRVFDQFGWGRRGRGAKETTVSTAELAALPKAVKSARKADEATRLALRRLTLAGLRDNDDDALVDACIGIEALLSDDSDALTYKIAMRGAAVLATRSASAGVPNPQQAFAMFKHVYARRSGLVHGTGKNKKASFETKERKISTARLAVSLLRELLLSRLTSGTAWTISDLDDELLSSLNRARKPSRRDKDRRPRRKPVVTYRLLRHRVQRRLSALSGLGNHRLLCRPDLGGKPSGCCSTACHGR